MVDTSPWACVLVALGYQDSYPGRVDASEDLTHYGWEVHAVRLDILGGLEYALIQVFFLGDMRVLEYKSMARFNLEWLSSCG